jgi:hypothetical protein
MCTVYDRIFGDSLPKVPLLHRVYVVLANPIYVYGVYYIQYIQYYWQGNHLIYGHIRCTYTVLANPK